MKRNRRRIIVGREDKSALNIIPLTVEEAQIWLRTVSYIKEAKDKG